MIRKSKKNYLNNKDMLAEIHKSKVSYCEFMDNKYSMYDVIVVDKDECSTLATMEQGKLNRAKRLTTQLIEKELDSSKTLKEAKLKAGKILPEDIKDEEVVIRLLTYDHIPLDPTRKRKPRTEADLHVKLNFVPFIHYIMNEGVLTEVGRSHAKSGKFSLTHGSITDKLARMFILLVNKYSQRSNWRGYTYLDEMKGQSLLQLTSMGLQFNEFKSDNPFAYYTSSINNSFTKVLNTEKRNQDIRDNILMQNGQTPSFSKQLEYENDFRKLVSEAEKED